MPRRTKRKPTTRTRRDPYQRTLEDATTKLEKAKAERLACEHRLHELRTEIPRLERIIQALDGEPVKRVPIVADKYSPALPLTGFTVPVPDHLKRFIGPTPSVEEVEAPVSEEDQFLVDPIPDTR